MITPSQRKDIEEKLANCDDQTPEFQEWARATLEREAYESNRRHGVVGYKCPPVKYQFKKGNPGGPGRPKATTIYLETMQALFGNDKKAVKQIVNNLIQRAQDGNITAIKILFMIERKAKRR
jgi:hypothetical protein